MDVHRRKAARRLRVSVGHRDGDGLLEREHVVDPGLAREPVHQRELRRARVAEHDRDAFLLEDLEKRLLAGDVCHGAQMISSHASVTKSKDREVGVVRLGFIVVALTACGTAGGYLSPSGSTVTLMAGWEHRFTLDWAVDPEQGQSRR